MNKELLRAKLIKAWSNGYIEPYPRSRWGFVAGGKFNSHSMSECIGISSDYFMSREFDKAAKEVAKEILKSPLMQALA